MPLHDELLLLSRRLVNTAPVPPSQAELRRGVSTAYYALFHLLIHESCSRIVSLVAMRPRVVRAFDHRDMRKVCEDYTKPVDPSGQPIPVEIQRLAAAFIALQQARHDADYNTSAPLSLLDAQTQVQLAEDAFNQWAAIRADPASDGFLTDLLFQSIRKR